MLSRFPYPLEKGDKLRAYHQLKELSEHHSITLFAINDAKVSDEDLAIVKAFCEEVHIHQQSMLQKTSGLLRSWTGGLPYQVGYFYSYKAHRQLKIVIQNQSFDHIFCQLIRMSEYVKNEHLHAKTLDYMDTLSAGIERRIDQQAWFKRWLFRSEAKRLKVYESKMFDFFENKVIISEQDRNLIHHPDAKEIHCIPNGIASEFFEEIAIDKSHDFVFVGNMSYAPNIEAVQYIAREILPNFPNSKLLISGSSPATAVQRLSQHSQITLTGWVHDIRESYVSAKIFLAPMMIGTGMQNKLLEAMALGIPCITTSLANNAIHARHEEHILVANDADQFKEAIRRLQEDQELYSKLKNNARSFVQDRYSWKETAEHLRKLFD